MRRQQKMVHISRQRAYDFMMGLTGPYIDSEGSGWYIRQVMPYEGGITLLVERRLSIWEMVKAFVRYS